MSNERPIIFSGDMVRAILAGRKTMTRRVVRPQPPDGGAIVPRGGWVYVDCNGDALGPAYCPYAASRLWVREAHSYADVIRSQYDADLVVVDYRADNERGYCPVDEWVADDVSTWIADREVDGNGDNWRPSIHMPRWASRLTLEVMSFRVERVQDISPRDILREGVGDVYKAPEQLRPMFACLWNSINARRGYPWASNPFVWVIEFRRLQP